MLILLVESLEKDLQNTTKIKNELNDTCDVSWSLLCPPGSGNAGKFNVGGSKNCTKSKKDSEGCSSLSNDLYSDISDLINYGKLVRSSDNFSNKRGLDTLTVRLGNNEKCNKIKNLEKTSVERKTSNLRTGRSASLNLKNQRSFNQNKDHYTDRVGDRKNKNNDVHEGSPNMSTSFSYSHTCSLNLSEQIYAMKMSRDVNDLLKLFSSYISLKSNCSQNTPSNQHFGQDFSRKFKNCVKLKLQNDLHQTNHYDEYMNYVAFSERAVDRKIKSQEPPLIQYRSKEQLEMFETNSHKLLELQLQSELLNTIADYLTDLQDGISD